MILEWEVNGRQQRYSLPPDAQTTIGRSDGCNVVLTDATVSRRHAEIYARNGMFYIRNLSRTNGLALEHQYRTIRLAWGQEAPLLPGARLQVGTVWMRSEPALVALRLRCPGPCGKVVEVPPSGFCPNCGTALATADTFTG